MCPSLLGNVFMLMPPQSCLYILPNQDDNALVDMLKHLQEPFPVLQSNALEYK